MKIKITVEYSWDVKKEDLHHYKAKTIEGAAKLTAKQIRNGDLMLEELSGTADRIKVLKVEGIH
jgi:hypothetical protein